ncbi:hypothetical protein D3C80_1509720 [compost metagenome]
MRQQLLLIPCQPTRQLLVRYLRLKLRTAGRDAFHAVHHTGFHLAPGQVGDDGGEQQEYKLLLPASQLSCRAFDALLYQCSGAAAGVEAGRLEAFFGVPGRGDAFLQGREAGGQALVKIFGDGGQAQGHENQVADL